MSRAKTPSRPRPRTYAVGDRVQIAFGVVGRVTEVIRRNAPPFFGYGVSIDGRAPIEVQGAQVQDPPRPMLDEWRFWNQEDLGVNFVAVLDDSRLAQLQREYSEANPEQARRWPRLIPQRWDGAEPLHYVKVTRTATRERNISSNGAFIREFDRFYYWLKCTCGLHQCWDSRHAAHTVKEGHETLTEATDHLTPSRKRRR